MIEEKKRQEEIEREKMQSHYNVRPEFGGNGPSKLRRQFSKGMTFFLVIAACIAFYFALLRMTHISDTFQVVFDVLKPVDRKSTRLNSSHSRASRMPSSA